MKETKYKYKIVINSEELEKTLNTENTDLQLSEVLCVELAGFIIVWMV